MSKKTYYIDTENLSVELDTTILQDSDRISESPLTDLLRFSCGNFYNINKNNLEKYSGNKLASIDTISINNEIETIQLKADELAFSKKIVNSQGLIQRIFDYKKWENFISNDLTSIFGLSFLDHFTEINKPQNISEVKDNVQSANIFNREFTYNFYSPEYEQLTANQNINEIVFPNIYDFVRDRNADIDTPTENLRISLGGLVPEYLSQGVLQSTNITDNGKKYFAEFAKKVNSSDANIVINEIVSSKPLVYFIDNTTLDLLPAELFNKSPFPFAIKMLFKSNIDTLFLNKVTEKDLANTLFSAIIDATTETQFTSPATREFYDYNSESGKLDTESLNLYDFKKFLQSSILPEQSGDIGNNFDINLNSNLLNFADFIKNNYTTKRRKYSELLTKAHTSVLFYRLIKKPISAKAKPSQVFYIVSNKSDMIRFIDTQVRYDRNYEYELQAATLIVGNKYRYLNDYYKTDFEKNRDLQNGFYRLNVVNSSSMQIVFIPLTTFNGSIIQTPPTKPSIEIANINRKLTMKILQSSEFEREKQEIIEDADFSKFRKISQIQDNNDKEIFFNNFSDTRKIQIYKTITRPKFYSDFNGKLYKTLTVSKSLGSFEDEVIPNVNYFYTFRYLNEHDLPSNPTKVYKLCLKDEDGLVYLEKEIINLEKELLVSNEKSFKRFLYISPSINQKVVNNDIKTLEKILENSNNATPIELGVEKSSVWDKQFVMVIRSKDSGKLLKYRFKFKINKQKE